MPREHPKYVVRDTTDGIERWYFRRKGQPKVRLPGTPWSPEFMRVYYEALNGTDEPKPKGRGSNEGTWRWLCEKWLASAEARQLAARTLRVRRKILQDSWLEPKLITEPNGPTFGDMPLRFFDPRAVGVLMDRKAETPEAANDRRKAISTVFRWALQPKVALADRNPARDVAKFRAKGEGIHPWTDAEIEQYQRRHPIGTKARLALELLLQLSQRRSDVVLFGRQHLRDGWLHFTQFKGRERTPITLDLPIKPELQAVIEATPCGDLTFLVTEFGKPFTANGFGNKFRDWCNEAGLKHCSSHGLRKAGARRLAEKGKTGHEIKAVTGHRTLKEVDRYTESARQKILAGRALLDDSGTKVSSRKRG